MRERVLTMLVVSPVVIAFVLETSNKIAVLVGTPMLIAALVFYPRWARPRRKASPMTQMIVLTVVGVWAVIAGLMAMVIWDVINQIPSR